MAQSLRRHFPQAHIAMLIRRYTEEIVRGHPAVDEVVFTDDGTKELPFFRLVGILRGGGYDAVFHTHPRIDLALITWLAGIPVRIGTGYRWYSFLFNRRVFEHRKDARFHELEYNLHLLQSVGCPPETEKILPFVPVGEEETARVRGMLAHDGVNPGESLIVLHPGSGGSAREWSPAKFGELGRLLAELPRVRVLVAGSAAEADVVGRIKGLIGARGLGWAGRVTLKEYAALLREASLCVANSTGPLHLAAAVGTPVIGLYPQIRALSAARWGPYTDAKSVFTPEGKPAECNECAAGGPCACMDSIAVADVFAEARRRVFAHAEQA